MDRNSVIGFVLLGALLVAYLTISNRQESAAKLEKIRKDSIAQANLPKTAPVDTVAQAAGVAVDSARLAGEYGTFAAAAGGNEQTTILENNVVKIIFTNKGGDAQSVQLKNFKTFDGGPLMLQEGSLNRLALQLPAAGHTLNTADLYFTPAYTEVNGAKTLTYHLPTSNPEQYLEYIYTLQPNSYLVDFTVRAVGLENVLVPGTNALTMQWNAQAGKQEQDMQNERTNNQVHYQTEAGKHDFFTLSRTSHEQLSNPLQWVSFKQQFFNVALIAKDKHNFNSADFNTQVPESGNIVGISYATLQLPYDRSHDFRFPMEIYYGPNHYKTLKSYNIGLENIIPLGSGIFFWVKYVNKWVIIPVFNFLSGFIHNYGVIIILLTIFIRLLISPFTYQSYVSQAKMKVLKPELDELRAKYADDQQAFGVEQMKLFKSAGVSPLGGCLPALLQLPILVAMYNFFPSSIELRQQSFLWAKDLSTYDSILNFSFNIPFYGNHVSLFTLLMTATSLILAFYNRGMADQSNPVMKYMPFVFPIMLLGIFNKLAAALTFYYFLSNTISIILQWVLQNLVIDHAKIHAQIQENKKKPTTKSKWAERLEEMQKRQQEAQRGKK
ncbi:YidC/Oxa1 family membrane protein insertase [Chitinophaga costaii]|uniref:Membrane protein insertase YidC n=1 Tax=Chitinophaga costaii TaxID=1335309 RepID=A0A1C4DC89_9BACT|nr:membrane protein insertase YidC [Chitinophaga costaii]PUZ24558.1 membrane protein insertase YidC [Chitinophaga costaii]SCC28883.1 YidC/Oxa1 family membrane protein insertase [Chitinophaga costaii]